MKNKSIVLAIMTGVAFMCLSACGNAAKPQAQTASPDAAAAQQTVAADQTGTVAEAAGAQAETVGDAAGAQAGTVADAAGQKAAGAQEDTISEQKAIEIAMDHAGVSAADVMYSRAKAEYEDDYEKMIYEVEFQVGRKEYEYDIAADTGNILSFSVDMDE